MLPDRHAKGGAAKFSDRWLYGACWWGGPGAGTSGNAGGSTGAAGDGGDGGGDGGGGGAPGGAPGGQEGVTSSVSTGPTTATNTTNFGNVSNVSGTTNTGFGVADAGTAAAPAAASGGGFGRGGFGGGIGGGAGAGGGPGTGGNAGGTAGGGGGAATLGAPSLSSLANLFGGLFGTPANAKSTLRASPLSSFGPAGQSTNPADTAALGQAANIAVPNLGTLAQQSATLGLPSLTDLVNGAFGGTIGVGGSAPPGGINVGGVPGPEAFGGTVTVGGSPAPGGITTGGLTGPGFNFGGGGGGGGAPGGVAGAPATVGPGSPSPRGTGTTGAPPGVTSIANNLIAHHPDMPFSTALAIATHMASGGTAEGEDANATPFARMSDQEIDAANKSPDPMTLPGVPNLSFFDMMEAPGTVSDNPGIRGNTAALNAYNQGI